MSGDYTLRVRADPKTGAVLISVGPAEVIMDEKVARETANLLREAASTLRRRRIEGEGGRRWELRTNDGALEASFWEGKSRAYDVLHLSQHETRKSWTCSKCKRQLDAGAPTWRDARHGGRLGIVRFCEWCVDRASMVFPPLRLLPGGAG